MLVTNGGTTLENTKQNLDENMQQVDLSASLE